MMDCINWWCIIRDDVSATDAAAVTEATASDASAAATAAADVAAVCSDYPLAI